MLLETSAKAEEQRGRGTTCVVEVALANAQGKNASREARCGMLGALTVAQGVASREAGRGRSRGTRDTA
jgi:hypothetical protein